jgi:hypothetical protein
LGQTDDYNIDGFKCRLGQTNDYNISICCCSAKQAALRSKSKDWLTRNKDNVYEWSYTLTC